MGCEAVMDNESVVGSDVIVFGVAEFAACSVVIVGVSSKTLGPGLWADDSCDPAGEATSNMGIGWIHRMGTEATTLF
jgi:hypothetical protein